MEGFSIRHPGDKRWAVYHKGGNTFVYAPSEAIAIVRFLAKYPDKTVLKVEPRNG